MTLQKKIAIGAGIVVAGAATYFLYSKFGGRVASGAEDAGDVVVGDEAVGNIDDVDVPVINDDEVVGADDIH